MNTQTETGPASDAVPAAPHATHACANCGAPMYGPFCYACGQPVKGLVRPLGSLFGDVLDNVFNIDTRIVRTLGPLFATGNKQNPDPVVGLEEFRRLRRLTQRPLAAIGGITRQRAAEARSAGADSLAVIGDLFPEDLSKITLRTRTEEWIQLLKT